MSKLKKKKYIAGILIVVILLGIIGLFSHGKIDKYKGLVKVNKVKLLSSVVNTTNEESKGTEEVKYNLTYTLDEVSGITKRDVIIKGKLNSPYARFKEINKNNITSTLINDGKEIEINISDVDLGVEQNLEIKIQVLNAPNNENIIPEISIKESTGEYTRVTGSPIKVETNSVEGQVLDNNNLPVSNIELSISKEEREIKRTYTDENGKYVFSDLTPGNYIITVEEEIYEIVSGSETSESNPNNQIKVKEVDKFNIETKKYIEKLDLVINGKEEHYTYKDAEKVVQAIKNAKRISGKIEYKIVVRNKGSKLTEIEEIEDTPGPGLEFKESENEGWKNKEGKIVYELMEGVSLRSKEKREIKLVLSINDTNEIKTYINKLTSKGEIKEKVVFVIDGEIKRELEVTEGTVIERPDFHIDDLDGWYTDSNYTNKYKFSNRVNKDLILYARTNEEKPKYQVRYIDKNEVIKTEEVEEGNKTSAPNDPSKTGYTFNCWKKGNSCFDFDTEIHEDTDLISDYDIITYHITYHLQGGTAQDNPDTYTVETDTFTLNNPSKEGHTFTGWTGSNGDTPSTSVTIEKGTTGDKEYTANYQIDKYQLVIDPKGGSYSGDLLLEEDYGTIVSIGEPTKTGYTFTGWTLTGSGTYNNGIYTFGEGNGKLEANYEVIEYEIKYKGITDSEREALSNPTSYTIETTEFTLHNPNNRLNEDNEGEIFIGWKEKNSDTPSILITLPDRNDLGNKEYTAIWQEREADKWNIIYNLNGGEVSGNPSSYKRSQLPITLNNPEKAGYTFIGWTGSNGDTPGNVTIPRGTEGDLSYTANYTLNSYGITYDYTSCNLTPEEITTLNNRGSYTIEDNNFNLNNPNKYGYVFEGWTGTDLTSKTINVEVDTSKIKNLSYTANCVLDTYDVEFYNMKSNGTYELSTTVSDIEYNTSIPSNKIPTVSLRGYTFKYWSLDKTTEFNLSTPIVEDTVVYAVYQKDIYPITYNLDGGTVSGNPESYSVDTEEFTLNNPTKTGYDFIGWTGSCGDSPLKVVTLPEEELGPKNYTANYTKKKFKVTYMNGETKYDEEEVEYNEKATGNVERPTKAHNVFIGWTLNNSLYDFDTPVTENITLYASWEEVESPLITHTPSVWVPDKVMVTIGNKGTTGKDYTGYTYKYKIGSGSYQDYTEAFEVDENTTIYAYSVKDSINSIEESHEITNIDKINPSINEKSVSSLAPTSVTLNIKGQDLESGLAYIKVYLGSNEVFSSNEYPGNNTEEQEIDVTIGNLEQLTDYTFTIEVIDKVGNTYSEEIEASTPEKHYVARTLEDDGTEIHKYETLKEAIESDECINICTIQMLDEVTETNSVLDGQDITLDLNGHLITGLTDKAFENNGILQIVDHNENETGRIYSEGIAIVNTGALTIGENEEELSVSSTEPIIEGSITGINSPGTLNFFDGKIIGSSTSGALKGSAPITPYSYNASVDTTGGKEIATLEVIADAEARINSVYYTKVQEAVDDSKKGGYTTGATPTEIMSQAKFLNDYGFIYNAEEGTLTNNNQGISNTTANSYIYIDTRGEANDKVLSIEASISSEENYNRSSFDIGYVTITNTKAVPAYDQSTGRIMYMYGTRNDNANYLLEKDKEYYLHLGYYKNGSNDSGTDTFTINNIKISDYSLSNINDYKDYLISTNEYHFKKQEDGSYISNNNYSSRYSTAHSYLKIDLTNETEEKVLYLDAELTNTGRCSSWGCGTYGNSFVTITNTEDMPTYDQIEGRIIYYNTNQSRRLYEIPLIPNQVNYVHLGYYYLDNYSYPEFNFHLYSIKLQDEKIKDTFTGDIESNGTYFFEEIDYSPNLWKDLSGTNNGIIYNSTLNSNEDGYEFNGTNSYVSFNDLEIDTEETVELEFSTTSSGNQVIYQGNSYGNDRIAIGIMDGYLVGTNRNVSTGSFELPNDYNDGTKKKITVTYNNGDYKLYYNNVELDKANVSKYYWNNGRINTLGVRDSSNYFNGTIYSVKAYNKSLTSEEIIDTSSISDNLLLHYDASNYKVLLEEPALINNNQYRRNTNAYSYMTFDLTDVTQYKTIYINCEFTTTSRSNFAAIHVLDNSTPVDPALVNNRIVGLQDTVSAQDYAITLTPGKVNYLQFSFRNYDGSNSTFKINYIRYYEDSSSTTPTYIFGNTTSKQKQGNVVVLNEQPDTVQIIRNITMTKPLEIDETRDVVLDLNGYTLTTSTDDYVVKNEGSLKVIDTNYTNQPIVAQETYETELASYNEQVQKYNNYIGSATYFVDNNYNINYEYTGSYQEFIAPVDGTYKIEAWGAQGGTGGKEGGKGAYTSGLLDLSAGDEIYIYVGGQPEDSPRQSGGYNGGGNVSPNDDGTGRAGGGSTDIRLVSGSWNDDSSLNSRIMVAAGGGGSACESTNWCASGGAGGALTGLSSNNSSSSAAPYVGTGGTQTTGGSYLNPNSSRPSGLSTLGIFGKGGDSGSLDDSGAGGSGYYGGGGSSYASAGGGGSSYISGYLGSVAITSASDRSPKLGCSDGTTDVACSYHYSNKIFDDSIMKSGEESIPTHDGTDTMIGNEGNGYARISIVDEDLKNSLLEISETESVVETERPGEAPVLNTNYIQTGNITSTTNSVILNESSGYLNIEEGIINIKKDGTYAAINNRGTLTMGEEAYINGSNTSNRGIVNNSTGDILQGTGNITMTGSSNIAILNDSQVDEEIKGYILKVTNSNSTNFYNRSRVDLTIDGINTSGAGIDINQNIDTNLIVKNSTLESTSNESYYSNETSVESNVTFDNCTIKNRIYNRSNSARTILIKDSTLTSSRGNVFNQGGKITIEDSNLTCSANNSQGNVDNRSNVEINDSVLISTGTNDYYGFNVRNGLAGAYGVAAVEGTTVINNSILTSNTRNFKNDKGTSTINNSIINSVGNSIYNGGYYGGDYIPATISINNTSINKTDSSDSNIVYNLCGTMTINGGSVTSESDNSTAIYNENNGNNTLTIKGEFTTGDNLTRAVYNKSVFTLGDNEDESVSKTYPSLNSTNSTIYNADTATFNYYDGKLVGIKDNALDGPIADIATLHDLNVTKGESLETIILKTKEEADEEDYVARIGSTNYPTIQSAFDAVPDNNTETEVVLLKDIESGAIVTILENKNIKFNYNGHSIKSYNFDNYIINNGTLTLVDTEDTVNNKSYSTSIFKNNGTINYNSIKSMPIRTKKVVINNQDSTFNMNGGEIYSYQTCIIDNDGYFNMNDGKLYMSKTNTSANSSDNLIINNSNGEMTIDGGYILIVSSGSGIVNNNKLTINNVTVDLNGYYERNYSYFITSKENSETKILGGTFGNSYFNGSLLKNGGVAEVKNLTSNLYGPVWNTGTVDIDKVIMENLSGNSNISNYMYNSGIMNIKDSSFIENNGNGITRGFIHNVGAANLSMEDSNITLNGSGHGNIIRLEGSSNSIIANCNLINTAPTNYYAGSVLYVKDSSSLTSNNNKLSVTTSANWNADVNPYAIRHNSTGEIVLNNTTASSYYHAIYKTNTGNLTVTGGSYTSTNQYGINNTTTGTITIGEKGGVPSKTDPTIKGKTYGLYSSNNDAVINFYDGVFIGETAIQGKITEIEPNYEIILDTDENDLEHKYLDRLPVVKNTRDDSEYYTIQEGVDATQSGDTLEVLRELTLLPDAATVTVGSDKNLTLDLKGYKITQNNEKFLVNNGIFKIKTSEDGGKIESNSGMLFENNNNFTIDNGTYNITTSELMYKNNENAIFTINDGETYCSESTIMINDGELNILGGRMRTTRTSTNYGPTINMIENTDTVNVENASFVFIGSGAVINNSGTVTSLNAKVDLLGRTIYGSYGINDAMYTNYINNNSETSVASIEGGEYGKTNKDGRLVQNNGTVTITNVENDLYGTVKNHATGTAIIDNLTSNNIYSRLNNSLAFGGLYNLGNLEIKDSNMQLSNNGGYSYPMVYSEGDISIDNCTIINAYLYNEVVSFAGSKTAEIKNSTIKNTNSNSLPQGIIKISGSTTVDIIDTDIVSTYNDSYNYDTYNNYGALMHSGSGIVNVTNSTVNAAKHNAIFCNGTGTLNINSGTYISTNRYGLYNTGSGTINIGVLGGTVSKTVPEITGTTYGLYNSNTSATINFYDGIFTGQTAIYGKITDVEPTYEIIQAHNEDDTYSKYLDQIPLVKNTRTDEEFNTIQDAISDSGFTNGDTLEVLRELTTLPSYTTITIPSGTDVVIDMKGYKFNQNNEKLFVNNGALKITDSEATPGNIQTFSGTIMENNGTLTVENIKLYTETSISKLIINNENANFTFNNVNLTSPNYQLIQNDGTMNINGGNYKQTTAGNAGYDSECIINNTATGTLNISAGNFENRGNGTVGIYNYNILNITGGTFTEKGGGSSEYRYESNCIYNASTGTLTIDGATFNNTHNYGRFLINYGTSTISNSTITMKYIMNNNSGTVSFTDNTITLPISGGGRENIYTVNSAITNITGGTITSTAGIHFLTAKNNAEINLTNTTIDANGEGLGYFYDNAHINVFGGTYRSTNSYSQERALFEFYYTSSGTFTNANIDGLNEYAISTNNNNTIDITNCNISSNITTLVITSNGVANINSGNITSTGANAVYVAGTSKVTVGEKGGVPSTTSPVLYGKTYGLNHTNNTSEFNFYDGLIKGETVSISGIINNVEDGYKEKRDNVTDPDTGVTTIDSTLTVVGDTERVAMVGTVNFLSLQSAVNYASNNNIQDIQMFKSVTLEADLVKPEGGANVVIHLNNNTINQGSYTIGDGITIDNGTDPGASLSRFLANISGQEINPKNIVIYEMGDGSSLEANVTYKLYKEMDRQNKIVKVKENKVGDYDLGNDTDILRTTRSRIYINGIGEGTYKLVGSDSKEIVFTISQNGVSNNIRDNNNINGSRISTAIATLILSLQTGMFRHPFILVIMILIVSILGFIAYQKHKREDYQE